MTNGIVKGKALVAVCDILGFSDLVLREQLENVCESYHSS